MSVTYKDIDQLSQKPAVAGAEKIPVSDTQYLTPDQIATHKRVHLQDESDMPASPDASTLYLIDDDGTGGGGNANIVHLEDESEMPASPDPDTLYVIDAEATRATSMPSGGFKPNILYVLGTLTGTVTFSLASPASQYMVNHYYWTFDTGSTAPTVTWPSGLSWNGGSAPTIAASKHYEISVLEGVAAYMEV